jgi:hypothetical protein
MRPAALASRNPLAPLAPPGLLLFHSIERPDSPAASIAGAGAGREKDPERCIRRRRRSEKRGMASAGGRKKRVGRYEMGRTIGQGSFAKVKFAVDSETGTAVAMKVIDKDTILRHRMLHQVLRRRAFIPVLNFSGSLEAQIQIGFQLPISARSKQASFPPSPACPPGIPGQTRYRRMFRGKVGNSGARHEYALDNREQRKRYSKPHQLVGSSA